MADTSPGKVQALCAMFAQNDAVMGLLPQNGKLGARPWKRSMTSLTDDTAAAATESETVVSSPVNNSSATRAILKILQQQDLVAQCEPKDSFPYDVPSRVVHKPVVGPKPLFVKQRCRAFPTPVLRSPQNRTEKGSAEKCPPSVVVPEKPPRNIPSLKLCELKELSLVHSYVNTEVTTSKHSLENSDNSSVVLGPVPKTKSLSNKSNSELISNTSDVPTGAAQNIDAASRLNLISSDNYICKSNCKYVRNKLPARDRMGPAPLKPLKPAHLRLPKELSFRSCIPQQRTSSQATTPHTSGCVEVAVPQRHAPYLCRPTTPPPVPPSSTPPVSNSEQNSGSSVSDKSSKSLLAEIEELYEDTVLSGNPQRPISYIPEYTIEEETGGVFCDLYDDAGHAEPNFASPPCPPKPRHPPPSPPSTYFDPITDIVSEELYQDAIEPLQDEFYEEMPIDLLEEEHYVNNRKALEKLRREKEKRLRKESKEKEKREKEVEKAKKKFGLSGNEMPIDTGLVKCDSKGGRNDIQVSKGEVVYILRIEGNPVGKWLVRNKKGKYGYVELTNIEVDPDSVKCPSTKPSGSLLNLCESTKTETWLSKITACVR